MDMDIDELIAELKEALSAKPGKAEKAELRLQKKKDRRKNSKLHKKALAKAQADALLAAKSAMHRPCSECGKPAKPDPDFFLNPVQCSHCSQRSRDFDLGIRPKSSANLASIRILRGGAPGLGKRK